MYSTQRCCQRGCSARTAWQRQSAVDVYARRTFKGKGTQQQQAGTKTRSRSKSLEPVKKPAAVTTPAKAAGGSAAKAAPPSALTQFVRNTPGLNLFLDGTLLFGDMVMLAATEVSSGRIPYEDLVQLTGVMIGSWVVAAAAMGDYKGMPKSQDNWVMSLAGPALPAVVDACITWALATTVAVGIYSVMVSSNMMDSGPLLEDLATENMSPQLEVSVATLITMACWRGIAARLRG